MMYKLIIIILILFIFGTGKSSAQSYHAADSAIYINDIRNFEKYIAGHYLPDKQQIKQLCENSCVFIRFKVLKGGKIAGLAFNKNIPPIITDALTVAFKSAENNSVLPEDLQSDDQTYLLPFIYYYNSGCYIMRKEEDLKLSRLDGTGKIVDEEHQGTAIYNILNFTDSHFDILHCKILNPIKIGKKDN